MKVSDNDPELSSGHGSIDFSFELAFTLIYHPASIVLNIEINVPFNLYDYLS